MDSELPLLEAVAGALEGPQLDAALERALAGIVRALDAAAAWIWLVDPETRRFYLAAAHGLPPYLREPVQMTGDPCWCLESFLDGDFASTNVELIACSRLRRGARSGAATGGLQSHTSSVLRFGGRQLGILNVCPTPPRRLGPEELRLLGALSSHLGLAVERAHLAESGTDAARSAERTRLARELHDTLAQDLTAIGLQLESALRAADASSIEIVAPIRTALDVARAATSQVRGSVASLRSDPLAGRSLAAALAALARRTTSESGIRTTFRAGGDAVLPFEVEVELYRIAAEAVTNARTHASPTRIELELEVCGDAVTLRVRDDGAGFDPSGSHGGYGLVGMAERAEHAGGTLQVTTAPGTGTLVEARVARSAP